MAGLPASGKSSLARKLADALPGFLLDKDEVRAALFRNRVTYTGKQNDLCMDIIYGAAKHLLENKLESYIILDGRTYAKQYQIDAVKAAAAEVGAALKVIECICSPETARARLERDADQHLARNRNFNLYQQTRLSADPIPSPKLVIDTDEHPPEICLALALAYLTK